MFFGMSILEYMTTPLYMAELALGISLCIVFKPWQYFRK